MSKFSKGKKRKEPAISTAALPDIVFMLLFFFMVTAKFKDREAFVEVKKAVASEVTVLDKNKPIIYYWMGKPKDESKGTDYRVQVDDQLIAYNAEIQFYLSKLRQEDGFKEQWLSKVVNNFKVDQNTPMGLVRNVQNQLRDQDALRVQYSVKEDK